MKLDKVEVAKLLTNISAIDNRQVDEARVEAWFPIVKDYNYQDALEALPVFFQKSSEYLSPRGLIVGIKAVKEQRALKAEQAQRQLELSDTTGVPQPLCIEHGLKILSCDPCCRRLYEVAGNGPYITWGTMADDILTPATI